MIKKPNNRKSEENSLFRQLMRKRIGKMAHNTQNSGATKNFFIRHLDVIFAALNDGPFCAGLNDQHKQQMNTLKEMLQPLASDVFGQNYNNLEASLRTPHDIVFNLTGSVKSLIHNLSNFWGYIPNYGTVEKLRVNAIELLIEVYNKLTTEGGIWDIPFTPPQPALPNLPANTDSPASSDASR